MNAVLKKAFADIIFEDRNRDFGAYFLRRRYEKHILAALTVSAIFFASALSAPMIYSKYFAPPIAEKKVHIVEMVLEDIPSIAPEKELPPPPPPPPAPKIEQPQIAKVKFLPPVVRPDDKVEVEEVPPTTDQLAEANPGDVTQEGQLLNELVDVDTKVTEVVGTAEPEDNKIYTWVEESADFPGGVNSLKDFLMKNLNYPKEALDKQVSGVVVLKFVVNKDGSLADIKVVKSAGFGMDEEALRVLKLMPRWKPAKQNGSPARQEKSLKFPFTLK